MKIVDLNWKRTVNVSILQKPGFLVFSGESVNIDGRWAKDEIGNLWS